jgi:hypothetical protein
MVEGGLADARARDLLHWSGEGRIMKNSIFVASAIAVVLAVGFASAAADRYGTATASLEGPQPAIPSPSVVRANKVPGTIESTARRLMNSLRQRGFDVARGYFKLYTSDDCDLSYEVMRSCYGNNPAAPYVVPVVPAWPDEWVDPATDGAFGSTAKGYRASYRLDPREAIVILGVLPPPADYFGVQTYLFTRPGEWDTTSVPYTWLERNRAYMLETFFGVVPGNPQRLQLFANVSNSINNVVLRNRSGEDGWDSPRYFVITPDQVMDGALRNAFGAIGVADGDIFTEPIPGDMRIGLDQDSDDFLTVMRYAMPADGGGPGTRSDSWRERLPLVVLRIRDTRPGWPEPYAPVEFQERTGTQPPETVLAPDLIALAKAICRKWDQPCDLSGEAFAARVPAFLNMQQYPFQLRGDTCIAIGMNCLAPTEDTTYFISGKLPLDDERVYAAIGASGPSTGNATYLGLGLNSSLKKLAFHNISDEDLAGSASGFAEVPNHEKFFVQYFARDCHGIEDLTRVGDANHCFPLGSLLPACTDPWDLGCDMLVLSVRGYLRPGTERGTAPHLALTPRFIPLRRSPAPGSGL